jgi:hypothetical protein
VLKRSQKKELKPIFHLASAFLTLSSNAFDALNRIIAQQKPLNVITLSQTKKDTIKRMITLTSHFY